MPISTTCPQCAAGGTFPDSEAGTTLTCPACGGAIALPAKARPVVAAVAAQAKPVAAKPVAKPSATPKPKSEFSFDDDPDDAPKKKKPRPRDDDDEDERPRRKPAQKKGGAGKILLILGGIAFVLLAGCSGAVYYFYIKVDKAVTDIKSKMTFPTAPEASETKETKSTKPTGANSTMKQNVQKVTRDDSFAAFTAKVGPGMTAKISDLKNIFDAFEVGTGPQTKAVLQIVLDAYAPWVDAGRGLIFWDGGDFRALVVFAGVGAKKQDWKVYGVLTLERTATGSQYNEQVGLAHVTFGDPEAQKLKLQGWKNFRIDDGTDGEPSNTVKITAVDLAAEVFRNRAAADKKYSGVTLEITGELTAKAANGSELNLKGGTDEKSVKNLVILVTMKPSQQAAAERCELGSTVTVYGVLQGRVPPGSGIIPIKEAGIKN